MSTDGELNAMIKAIAVAGAAPYVEAGYRARVERLESLLEDVLEFLEGQVDVVDGSYGEPAPNRAMTLTTEIKEALGQ